MGATQIGFTALLAATQGWGTEAVMLFCNGILEAIRKAYALSGGSLGLSIMSWLHSAPYCCFTTIMNMHKRAHWARKCYPT